MAFMAISKTNNIQIISVLYHRTSYKYNDISQNIAALQQAESVTQFR